MWPGARTPPTEPLNSVSPVNTVGCSPTAAKHPRGVPGRVQRPISRAPQWIVSPACIVQAAIRGRQQLALERVDQHPELRPALAQVGTSLT